MLGVVSGIWYRHDKYIILWSIKLSTCYFTLAFVLVLVVAEWPGSWLGTWFCHAKMCRGNLHKQFSSKNILYDHKGATCLEICSYKIMTAIWNFTLKETWISELAFAFFEIVNVYSSENVFIRLTIWQVLSPCVSFQCHACPSAFCWFAYGIWLTCAACPWKDWGGRRSMDCTSSGSFTWEPGTPETYKCYRNL